MQLSHPANEAGSHGNAWSRRDPCPLGSLSTSELFLLFCCFFVQPAECFPFSLYLLFLAITSSFCPFARVDAPPLHSLAEGGSHLWHLATRYSLVLGSFSLNLWHEANEPQLAPTLTLSSLWNKVMETPPPLSWLPLQPYTSLCSSSPPSSSSIISLLFTPALSSGKVPVRRGKQEEVQTCMMSCLD